MATVSQRVRQVLAGCGKKQVELADYFGITRQAMSNKFARNSWSADELAKAARFAGAKLLIETPDGVRLEIEPGNAESPNAE